MCSNPRLITPSCCRPDQCQPSGIGGRTCTGGSGACSGSEPPCP
jgi:hypothetical protein